MPPKRPRDDGLDDDGAEHGTSAKVTWISNHLYQSLNDQREPARDRLNQRLTTAELPPRLARTIQRPMGEAGRTGTTTTGQPRNGFVLKEFLQRESNLTDKHYTMIQNTVHRLAAKHLDIRCTWRENQGDDIITVCLEAARLHPCLYDYDAFWPVHDHLKQHLKTTRDKYNYIDPDLNALHQAEESAKEADEPPPRKKQRTTSKVKQRIAPRSLSPSPPPPFARAVGASQPLPLPQQLELRQSVHPQLASRTHPTPQHPAELQQFQRIPPSQSLLPVQPIHSQAQRTHGRFEFEIANSQAGNEGFLMTLQRDLTAKGHLFRHDLPLRPQIWKILLGVKHCDAAEYNRYVSKGPSSMGLQKIVITLPLPARCAIAISISEENALSRLVHAFIWRWQNIKRRTPQILPTCFYAFMFLYTMPDEVEAFYSLDRFMERCLEYVGPRSYLRTTMALLTQIFEHFDGGLHAYLTSNALYHRLANYLVPSIASFFVCGRPWDQVTKLWDLFLSQGLHLNVLVAFAWVSLVRGAILEGKIPDSKFVIVILDAELLIRRTSELERRVPRHLLEELKKCVVVQYET